MVSRKLRARVKLSRYRQYELARAAGLHPTVFSKILNGAEPVKPNDPRVIAIGRVMGLEPEQCFEEANRGAGNGF